MGKISKPSNLAPVVSKNTHTHILVKKFIKCLDDVYIFIYICGEFKTDQMKKKRSKIPSFIPNQHTLAYSFIQGGSRNESELRKQRENQKKLMLNNKNHKY